MLNAPAAVGRALEHVVRGLLPAIGRDHHRGSAPSSLAARPAAAHARRSAARHDPRIVVLAAAAAIALRRRLSRLTTGRRPVPLAALAILVVCSVLSQANGIAAAGSSGATGGTSGAGEPANARIMQINIDGPDTGQVDPGLVAGAVTLPQVAPAADAGAPDAGAYTLVDGSLIKPITAEASAAADISGQVRTYVVRSGDTLSGIANRFGLSMMTIWWANKLASKDALQIGQKLQIPPVDGVLYTVQAGDTITSIARRFHASIADVRSFNDLTGDTVVIGQEVMVPDGRGAAIPTPSPAPLQASGGSGASGGSNGPAADGPVGGACTSCAFAGSMSWPVQGGFISQYYWWGHPALDIAAAYGTPVLAAASGTVIWAGWRNNGGGYQVWISHGNNVYTTYNHMSAILVGAGQSVGRGQEVGRIGATGDATGPHLHFEVWIGPIWAGGSRVNPLNYLSH